MNMSRSALRTQVNTFFDCYYTMISIYPSVHFLCNYGNVQISLLEFNIRKIAILNMQLHYIDVKSDMRASYDLHVYMFMCTQ